MNIYVGSLAYSATEDSLKALFEEFGPVKSVKVIKDQFTGKSRGFAFVEMANKEDGEKAMSALNGRNFEGHTLRINEARPREERPQRNDYRQNLFYYLQDLVISADLKVL